jgi:FkbM family methyltransferase
MTRSNETRDAPGRAALLATGRAVEASTDLGDLLLEADAEMMTPTVIEYGYWAPELSMLMRRYLRPGMTFVDAGANIGYFSVLGSQIVGPQGRVIPVEVDPDNLPILRENLDHLGDGNATVLPVAAWHEEATLEIVPSSGGGAGTLVAEASAKTKGKVRAAPLGVLVDGTVDLIKVDCEMTDHLVVKGAADLIRRNPDLLITVEFNPDFTGQTMFSPQDILDLYRDLGLKPYDISGEGDLTPTTYEAIAATGGSGETVIFDFALCAGTPKRLRRRPGSFKPRRILDSALRAGGNLLEYVPEPIRPKVRDRDRAKQGD